MTTFKQKNRNAVAAFAKNAGREGTRVLGERGYSRSGFTLIELLVVITLIMVLAGLAVMFVPRVAEQQRAAQGGALLQGWLNTAKTRALRDQAPRGLRLYVTYVAGSKVSTEAQYIDQPDDFTGGTVTVSGTTVTVAGADIYGGQAADTTGTLWAVQTGDYLEVLGTGLVHRISGVNASPANSFTIASGLPYAITGASNYRIIRAPRVSGEEKLQMPVDIAIDLTTNTTYASAPNAESPNGEPVDILFAPSGNIIANQVALNRIILWVRDMSIPIDQGDPTLIVTYVRSGLVASVPVDPSNGFVMPAATPYTFVVNP